MSDELVRADAWFHNKARYSDLLTEHLIRDLANRVLELETSANLRHQIMLRTTAERDSLRALLREVADAEKGQFVFGYDLRGRVDAALK